MKLVAVVLNWNGGADTIRAIESLDGIETICVDNGSTDGSDLEIERRFPSVELVRNGANLGYAGGNNVGIRRALERDADWMLLLNSDAWAQPGIADALTRAADSRPDAALLACKVLFEDGRVQYAGASFNTWLGYSGRSQRDESFGDTVRADGAAMALSRDAGLLDDALFAYVEDVELSLRVRASGRAVVFVPDAVVWHKGGASTGGRASPVALYYDTRNTIVVCERYRPLRVRWPRRLVIVAAHLVQTVRRPAGSSAVLAGWRDARSGRLGPRPH